MQEDAAPLMMKIRKGEYNAPHPHPRPMAGLLISSLRSMVTRRTVFRSRLDFAAMQFGCLSR